MYNLNVVLKGPTVEGLAGPMLAVALDAALEEVADYTKYEVNMELDTVLKNPTGYYESQIRSERVGLDEFSINDSGVIYGPWLEGVSSRNQSTSFKGYATFRRVRNRMVQKSEAIIGAAVGALCGRL
ncbi:hypothetical protein [Kitasatospora indigofera]|uniref:hypothetical protein n=1 Tax=Kitasatospora indigofera TaxID=67307 RepID=UPI00369EE023